MTGSHAFRGSMSALNGKRNSQLPLPVSAIDLSLKDRSNAFGSFAISLLPCSSWPGRDDVIGKEAAQASILVLAHEPKVIDAVGSGNSFDRRDKSSHDRSELGALAEVISPKSRRCRLV
jgi:hypothetical protein